MSHLANRLNSACPIGSYPELSAPRDNRGVTCQLATLPRGLYLVAMRTSSTRYATHWLPHQIRSICGAALLLWPGYRLAPDLELAIARLVTLVVGTTVYRSMYP